MIDVVAEGTDGLHDLECCERGVSLPVASDGAAHDGRGERGAVGGGEGATGGEDGAVLSHCHDVGFDASVG